MLNGGGASEVRVCTPNPPTTHGCAGWGCVWPQVHGYGQMLQGADPRRRASYLGRFVNGGKDGFGVARYPGGALFYKVGWRAKGLFF